MPRSCPIGLIVGSFESCFHAADRVDPYPRQGGIGIFQLHKHRG